MHFVVDLIIKEKYFKANNKNFTTPLEPLGSSGVVTIDENNKNNRR